MPTKRKSIDEIQDSIDEFVTGLPEIQRQQFNKVYALLKDLSLDNEGRIKTTIRNLQIINQVKSQLSTLTDDPQYQNKIEELQGAIDKVDKFQTLYYTATFSNFTKPKTIDKLNKLTFNSTVDQLMEAGINENVVNMSVDIVEQHIRDNSSFTTLVDELKVQMLGDKEVEPKLISYAKQVINDTLSGFARNYHNIVTADLNLEWFEYLGALVETSRPFCIELVSKYYIHKSELNKIAHGNIDGKKVSLAGLFPGTNGENIINRCGGYNCNHQLIPVPSVVIPTELRRKFEKDIEPDNAEKVNSRPKRKK